MVDESTDISATKSVAIVVRTVDSSLNVCDEFFDLIPISQASSTNLYEAISTPEPRRTT
jgi:hypothetical protein